MPATSMSFREMNLAVFQNRLIPHVLFQPRVEPWHHWHNAFGKTPARWQGVSVQEMFDRLGVSMRYIHYYTGMPNPFRMVYDKEVKIERQATEMASTEIYHTPLGDLVIAYEMTIDKEWREVGFPVKDERDLRKLLWLYQHARFEWLPDAFGQGAAFMGDRGVPQFWVPKSPYQALAQWWMKLEDLIYALADCTDLVEEVMAAIDASYDELYRGLAADGRLQIINFGDNLHEQLMSPDYFLRYIIPFYEKRCQQLRGAGIYSHVHIDGYFRHLLPYLNRLPQDGIEALTPKPQGDFTLEEMKEHIGDKVMLDGIPAVLFLENYSRDQLMACVEKIVDLFAPRLILGISDELPEGCGEEGMARVEMIAKWARGRANVARATRP